MGKKQKNTKEQVYSAGTYQTGVTGDTKKSSSGLIAVLLVLTIFLGGLASGLGIVNIRLVQQLMQQNNPTVSMNVLRPSSTQNSSSNALPELDTLEPLLPLGRKLTLSLMEPKKSTQPMDAMAVFASQKTSLVQVDSSTHHNTCSGSGVILDANGYILTNAHLVDAAKRIYVTLSDGSQHRATLVGTDTLTDLAVLYIEAQDLRAAEFADTKYVKADDPIVSTGTLLPRTDCPLVDGRLIVKQCSHQLGNHSLKLMQSTVGSENGPLFNRYGQIIGMNTGKVEDFCDLVVHEGTGYAIPSYMIRSVVEELTENGYVAGRPTLGIRVEAISKFYQQHWDLPGGLWIFSVSQNAQKMGLREGDILIALNGLPMTENDDLHRMIFSNEIGSELRAVIYREGESITLDLTILDTAA